ncbi:glycosyltransferase [Vibrio sonorensis]|uniref:glycosyltransferase n=1 Tax=Vibrio sonorensis TaxID=1004316 RepID=UPI0008DA0697|nr:glycosyltransferase [Vibrio sonorensis]
MYDASVIVSFYNNIGALSCIIKALENQSNNFELIIADDGSTPENVEKVKNLVEQSPLPIQHVWQKDSGFRKNRALNKAVKRSISPYLIFIDGDCIPQQNFVIDHLSNKALGIILNGRRVDMAPSFKEDLYTDTSPDAFFSRNLFSILIKYVLGKGKNIEKGIRVTNPWLFKRLNKKSKGIVGCNFSLHKQDFVEVNGFDNRYDVPCVGEDTDIEYRLLKVGKRVKNLFHQGIVLHILHPELPRLDRANELFEETKANQNFIALNGYQQADDIE